MSTGSNGDLIADPPCPDSPSVIWATLEHRNCARHRAYALTCDEFEELLERANGHCEICGAEGRPDIPGCCLNIDHEPYLGQWAVRGLLCYVCNVALNRNRRMPPTPQLRRYIANAWYLQAMERAAVTADMPPEPGLGSIVLASRHRYLRYSTEGSTDWVTYGGSRATKRSWQQLWREHGPLHIEVREIRTEISASERRRLQDSWHRHLLKKQPARSLPPSIDVLQERIARAHAQLAAHRWSESDRASIAGVIGILTGAGPGSEVRV